MRRTKQILVLIVVTAFVSQAAFAQMHVDPDTGITIKDVFDIELFATLPAFGDVLTFGKGGAFGTDLYVATIDKWRPTENKLYRVDSSGSVTLVSDLPARILGLDFPNPGSDFGDYIYMGSPDSYYAGNKTIYRMDSSGSVETFFEGSNFLGGTMGPVTFAPEGSPYGDYLFSQDDNPDQIYKIDSAGTATTFSSGIPFATDFLFDTYGQFDNQLIVVNIEKSEHGSSYNSLYKVATDGTKTTLLGDVIHMGGGLITPPDSPFGGKLFLTENAWPSPPTDLYAVSPDGSYEVFASGFYTFQDATNLALGPDGAMYVSTYNLGQIYRITPELVTLDIAIDIRPGNDQNPLNLKSNGVLPVAILGSDDFDVNDIDLSTLSLDGATPKQKGNSENVGSFEDVNADGLTDLLLHFDLGELNVAGSATELTLAGLLSDGTALTGTDSVRIVPAGDVNGDGSVSGADLTAIITNWGMTGALYNQGDLNGDGTVSGADYSEVITNWGQSSPPESPAATPEPATLALLIMGGLAALIRKHK